MKVAVLGGGVAGLASALILRRGGHDVTMIERDALDGPEDWHGAFEWPRRGIPHFFQPHAFLPRGTMEMKTHLPDVYALLLTNGAHPWDFAAKIPGETQTGDEELRGLAVRRPLIEWALRRTASAEPGLEIESGRTVTGLVVKGGRPTGVALRDGTIEAGIVVDAMGRTSPMSEWLEAAGASRALEESSECGINYYSRYYRVRDGEALPDNPGLLPPRVDFGYAGVASFFGDNNTFGLSMSVPARDGALKGLRDDDAYERVVGRVPQIAAWRAISDPITPVLPMSGLRNVFRDYAPGGDMSMPGVFPVGDAYCHTNPVYALGLSFSFAHAVALGRALRDHADDVAAAGRAYAQATREEARERFENASIADDERLRRWSGEPIDPFSRTATKALFPMIAPAVAGAVDADIARAWLRRFGMLARLSEMTRDEALMERTERVARDVISKFPPPPLTRRDEMLALIEG